MRGGHNNSHRNNYNNQQNHNNHNNHNNQQNSSNNANNSGPLAKVHVTGWVNSNASSNPDGGVDALIKWLQRRAGKNIIRHYQQRDTLVISVAQNEVDRFTHMNGFQWAGATLTIEPVGNRNQTQNANNQNQPNNLGHHQITNSRPNNQSSRGGRGGNRGGHQGDSTMQIEDGGNAIGPEKIEVALTAVIRRCYHPGNKFLNFANLPSHAEFQEIGLLSMPAAKVFSAIFVCCETKIFETPLKRQQMVESLSLNSNSLLSVKDCIAAAGTFNNILNLDLGNNQIKEIADLRYWRNRFPNLEHLILEGNPVDSPDTMKKMKEWYPKLKMYNNQPIPAIEAQGATGLPQGDTFAIQLLPNSQHPQIPSDSRYGQPEPGKPGDKLMKEQMVLKLSYETRLDINMSMQCLEANNWDYNKGIANLQDLINKGQITDSFLWTPESQPSL